MNSSSPAPTVAIVSLPSPFRKTNEGKLIDVPGFQAVVSSLASRLQAKDSKRTVLSFSTQGIHSLEKVLAEVAKEAGSRCRKVYFLMHGNEESVELPNKADVGPSEFADQLMKGLAWDQLVKNYLSSTIPGSFATKDSLTLKVNLRLLACLTGKKQGAPDGSSYAQKVMGCIELRLRKLIMEFALENNLSSFKASDWKFEIQCKIKAPVGWNVISKTGRAISYYSPGGDERGVDRLFKARYEQIDHVDDARKLIGDVVLHRNERSQITELRAVKYSGTKVFFEQSSS